MGLDLRSVVFAPVLAQMKMRAESLREVKGFPRTGIEGWLKVEVVAALGRKRVRKLCNDGPDLWLNDGTDEGTRLELKAATDFNRVYILKPLTEYDAPCLFLGDGRRFKSGSEAALFLKEYRDDFEMIGCEVFSDGEGQWVVGLVSPRRSQDNPDRIPAAAVFASRRRARTSFKAALKSQPIEIADLLQILARQLGQNVQADFVLSERICTAFLVRP